MMDLVMNRLSDDFFRSISEHNLRRLIEKAESALGIHAENTLPHRLQDEAAAFLGLPEFGSSLLHQVFQVRLVTSQFSFGLFGVLGAMFTGFFSF